MVKKRTKPPKGNKPYLIEHISSLDLGAWQRAATKIEKYHVQLFYYLAGQRALNASEIQEALLGSKIMKTTHSL